MHPKTKDNLGDITKIVLLLIAKGALVTLGAMLNGAAGVRHLDKEFGGLTNEQLSRCIRNMRLRGYITYERNDLESPLRVTAKGLLRIKKEEFSVRFVKCKTARWDHLWRIVMFDIPERRRRLRGQFREALDRLGLCQFQESIYICPFDCKPIIDEIIKMYRLDRYALVTVIPTLGPWESVARGWFIKCNEI